MTRDRLVSTAATLAVVVLLVGASFTGALGPSPVGTAEADDDGFVDTCTSGPLITFSGGMFGVLPDVCPAPETDTEDLEGADALETETSIYDSASTQAQNNEVFLTSFGNYLGDTRTIALMEGKNAYIRELNNGSSELAARNAATEAVADYYAMKQQNLLEQWNLTVSVYQRSKFVATNTSGVSSRFVDYNVSHSGGSGHESGQYPKRLGVTTETATLVNGSTQHVLTVKTKDSVMTVGDPTVVTHFMNPTNDDTASSEGSVTVTVGPLFVHSATDNFPNREFGDYREFRDQWQRIDSQNQEVQAQIDTFIDGTYEAYQRGEINSSNLVDPYLGLREYAPGNGSQFQSWTLRSLAAIGLDTPENLTNIGRMNVSVSGVTYQGILMSDGQPDGGFVVGETYDATQLKGHQFVALDDGGSKKLTGEFTLSAATTASGRTIQQNETIVYRNVTYETASTEDYQELMTRLNNLTAEINERQQRLRGGTGGGGIGASGRNIAIGVVALAALAFLANNNRQ